MPSEPQISEKLTEIVKKYIPEEDMPDKIDFEMDLTNDLGINSMHLVDIIIDIEDEFDLTINDSEIQQMTNVNSVIEIIQAKLNEKED